MRSYLTIVGVSAILVLSVFVSPGIGCHEEKNTISAKASSPRAAIDRTKPTTK